jgi:hypothetical protein
MSEEVSLFLGVLVKVLLKAIINLLIFICLSTRKLHICHFQSLSACLNTHFTFTPTYIDIM